MTRQPVRSKAGISKVVLAILVRTILVMDLGLFIALLMGPQAGFGWPSAVAVVAVGLMDVLPSLSALARTKPFGSLAMAQDAEPTDITGLPVAQVATTDPRI